ncbi:5'-phosphate synthase pdxT subunit [Sporomusaceae bacterium BoRhaA]|uniref:pyridoxal 5'-phosphate synthase glutaminase subunit PdxT n=1 Tax=Pelorhabdus rhamnosifermentans TaxID=2772457 RepID=UPI001C063E6B|nr:pyridoxal 5'-phosphate synthase glutaminase subunit PdxT [Pelorhabdus rhamnosifermentans]MBU2703916.1 5'-phosphate synthase pdxT subunit [Pelorhabdus rhamnosifermentans]
MKIGVLALQGAFREHCAMLNRCGAIAMEIRKASELDEISGLILPGGESTTIGKLLVDWGLMDKIKERAAQGMAIYGTCAGLILLAKTIRDSDQPRLGLMDITVQRNAFGRQTESFEADLTVPEFGPEPIRAVFIRAPWIEQAEANVKVLANVKDKIVIARQDKLLVTAFHPELTGDDRIHKYFIAMAQE